MDAFNVWGVPLPESELNESEKDYLSKLPQDMPPVEWVWKEMDRIWYDFGLDNHKPLSKQSIADFYSHPVWLMNGIFVSTDPQSYSHRTAISKWLKQNGAVAIADYGGGFGVLAKLISKQNQKARITVVEPYPSRMAQYLISKEPQVFLAEHLSPDTYDVVIAQDVLEHVEDPVGLVFEMVRSVKQGGFLLIANCFRPVIQCHLPNTFHLRCTFPYVMKQMGLEYCGAVDGALHVKIYKYKGLLAREKARKAEQLSRRVGPALNLCLNLLSPVRQMMASR